MDEKQNTLEEWTRNCHNLKAIFRKAKKEERKISIDGYMPSFSKEVYVVEAKDDYAIVSKIEGDGFGEGPRVRYNFIHPYGASLVYSIEKLNSTEEV